MRKYMEQRKTRRSFFPEVVELSLKVDFSKLDDVTQNYLMHLINAENYQEVYDVLTDLLQGENKLPVEKRAGLLEKAIQQPEPDPVARAHETKLTIRTGFGKGEK